MAVEGGNAETPTLPKPDPCSVSQASSSHPPPPVADPDNTSSPKKPPTAQEFILSVASKLSSQPLTNPDDNVWGVLTAISSNARKRHHGINMVLTADQHCIGRLVADARFQIESSAVSGSHCKIYRRNLSIEDTDTTVFLKDTSTNGTYLNWMKLTKSGPEAKVNHGDIISFSAPPQHELAFAFVFREVVRSTTLLNGGGAKRKAEEVVVENKRIKGIGIGAPAGPIYLDDFRSLQRSNTELRKQLEGQVLTVNTLRNEHRATVDRHENELKELKENVTNLYLDQVKELQHILDAKQKELLEINRISAEQKNVLEEINERLSASKQSCIEANEIMKSQKASIAELEAQLEEERDQRRDERQKAAIDLKAAVQKIQCELQEEVKRVSDTAMQRERELQEEISKLQEREKKWCSQVDTLRPKLEETRQKLVISDNKVRQLEAQVCEEQLATANAIKRVDELEQEIKRVSKDLENEKAAREEAWAKVSTLELEINAAMRDLEFERRRLKAARERIMLRETQLRAFYSTTEEISILFTKQQEQLKAMQKTLEDEENYDNTSVDVDDNATGNINDTFVRGKEMIRHHNNCGGKAGSATSGQRHEVTSSEEVSATQKHDCDIRSREDQNTQEEEFTSGGHHIKGGFGSEIDGVGTAPVLEGDAVGTECVMETESLGLDVERNFDLNKSSSLAGDTMQLDDETHAHESEDRVQNINFRLSRSNDLPENHIIIEDTEPGGTIIEDTEPGGTIRTADLLASEVVGSWAYSTAPSVHGDNESPINDQKAAAGLHDSNGQVAESQSTPSSEAAAKRNRECQALSEMIGIVAPDLKEQFGVAKDDDCMGREGKQGSTSNSDTESCTKSGDQDGACAAKCGSYSDAETQCSDEQEDLKNGVAMDEDSEATQEDSLG